MKVAITNTVALNGGDAAILLCLVRMVRKAFGEDVEIIVFDSQPEIAARYYPGFTFRLLEMLPAPLPKRRLRRLDRLLERVERVRFRTALRLLPVGLGSLLLRHSERRLVRQYAEMDLVIATGGTYLVENYDIGFRLGHFGLAQAAGTPVMLFTQSLGPFRKPRNRRSVKRVLSGARRILLRDARSRTHLIDAGVPESLMHICADGVFALADDVRLNAAAEGGRLPGQRLRVAISVREWSHFGSETPGSGMDRYCRAIAAVVEHLSREFDAEIVFLSTCQGIPEYWTDDSRTAARISELVAPELRDRVVVDRSFRRPDQLMEAYSGFDLLVSTRLHAAILALCAGTPVFPIEYEFKTTEVFAKLGLRDWIQDINTVQADTLPAKLGSFMRVLPALRGTLFRAVLSERDSAFQAVEVLADGFQSPGRLPAGAR